MKKPLILVTNDDGITAPGIRNLVNFMNEIGEVVVVAPNSPQSGKGHAITINSTLTFEEINLEGPQRDYSLSGTPVDCVKFALDKVLTRKPDLVVSGINHGANSSINVIYSGTMSAAVEAGVEGLQSIGFSLLDFCLGCRFLTMQRLYPKYCKKSFRKSIAKRNCAECEHPETEKRRNKRHQSLQTSPMQNGKKV